MPVHLRSPFAAAVAVCAVLTGCGSQVAGADPDPPNASATAPESYTYVLTSSCGERGLIGDYNVVVENGTVVSAESRNARYPYEPDLSEVPTLVDLIAKATSAPPRSVIEYTVDDAGLPKSLSLDPVPNGIDDEECYRVTGLRENEPGTATSEPTVATVEGDAAVWFPAPRSAIESSSTTFTVLVSRLGCNNGTTGRVQTPEIVSNESEVVITFTVAAKGPGAANCLGNQEVAYKIELGEPLLERALIDGQCLPGGEAVTTSFCVPDSARYEP